MKPAPPYLLRVVVAGLLGVACSSEPAPPSVPSNAPSSATVRWVAARSPSGTALLEAPAHVVVAPAGRAVITAPLRARVLAVRTQAGDAVTEGASLVDVALPEAAAAAAAYLAANDELVAHEQRAKQLEALRAEGLARVGDLATLQLEIAKLRGAREIAATTLRAAGLGLGEARAIAASGGRTSLRAPTSGVVMAVAAVLGASHAPEEILVELAAGTAQRVEARLPRPLPEGARVEFVPSGGEPIAAHVVSLAPARDSDGATRVWLDLATPAPAGALGRIRGSLPDAAAVAIPAAALAREKNGVFVWRRDGAATRKAPVHVIATSGADAIVDGLAIGDEVAAVAAAVPDESAP